MNKKIIKVEMNVNDIKVSVNRINNVEYISLTDLAKYVNEEFNSVELHRIKFEEVSYNRFTMALGRWKRDFNAIGIILSSG